MMGMQPRLPLLDMLKLTPRQALNKAFLKVKPTRAEIERFKTELVSLLNHLNPAESEEFHKHLLADFLKQTYYAPNHFINTKGHNDLVIHIGKDAASAVGVLIETKKPTNAVEMPKLDQLDSKALRELVLYYLRERVAGKNLDIKHLVATNVAEWFIFDATVFEKAFAQNTQLVKQFSDFEAGRLSGTTTDFFYEEIAKPAIAAHLDDLTFTHVALKEFDAALRNGGDDAALIPLFKLFSPQHLLKLPFANDSNTLDKSFYAELLHIIGLAETKEGSKKVIRRNAEGERHAAALIENAIIQLDAMDKLSNLTNPGQFGEHREERLFNVALELAITWINRVLFLKLLEAQLLAYNKNDPAQRFLNSTRLKNFERLNMLFFQVLARQPEERTPQINAAFATVPYLNSSLFDVTELEQATIVISNLNNDETLPLHPSTVLKDANGKRRTGSLPTLEYLFTFLDAYDFASDGGEGIQEERKALINAAVLGLIFEKINGYRDGSFFTPGFITMYMCRETLRRAVVQQFNERKGWQCASLDELYDKITDRHEANEIVNSLHICDPAVGSGHFLVSALNELIAIKSELEILQDRQGKRLKHYRVEVANDELIVTDEDGDLFDYRPASPESQRVQEALFHEKQTLIERCLFGVDINPNSVKICRLRLWIELLKNAYYKADGALETLPNIDINIKEGNSLISRFALDADLNAVLSRQKRSIAAYQAAVQAYRSARRKEEKRDIERLIAEIKSDFRMEIGRNDPNVKRLAKISAELITLQTQGGLFELSAKEQNARKRQEEKLQTEIAALTVEIEDMKQNKMYRNAFEWRFEFPEVLNDNGEFVGFDVVIGNPPYILIQNLGNQSLFDFYKNNYFTASYKVDTYHLFYEQGLKILRPNGYIAYISPNTFLKNKHARNLRKLLLRYRIIEVMNFYTHVFEDASVDTLIFMGKKDLPKQHVMNYIAYRNNTQQLDALPKRTHEQESFNKDDYHIELDVEPNITSIFQKLENNTIPLKEIGRAYFGIQTFDRTQFVTTQKLNDDYYPVIDGGNVKRYYCEPANEYVLFKKEAIKSGGDESVYHRQRIVVRQIGDYPEGVIIPPHLMTLNTIYNIFLHNNDYPLSCILGIINSTLIQFFWKKKYYDNKSTFPKIKKAPLESIPIPQNYNAEMSGKMVKIVDDILSMKAKDSAADTHALEAEIDRQVYALYGLTPEEIAMVEGNA